MLNSYTFDKEPSTENLNGKNVSIKVGWKNNNCLGEKTQLLWENTLASKKVRVQ